MCALCEYVHTRSGPHRGQVSDLELQVVVNPLAWVLGIELQHSGRAVCALQC